MILSALAQFCPTKGERVGSIAEGTNYGAMTGGTGLHHLVNPIHLIWMITLNRTRGGRTRMVSVSTSTADSYPKYPYAVFSSGQITVQKKALSQDTQILHLHRRQMMKIVSDYTFITSLPCMQ